MTETLTDLYAGAGGSCQGAAAVEGLEIMMAANHWPVAVASHQANFPHVDHDCADISQVDPRRYPSTTILWASPECTNHSGAKGRKATGQPGLFGEDGPDPGAERSRATMWDVCRFAEHHQYAAVVVENVVEVLRWVMWPAWLHAMRTLGYRHQVVFLNSMHAPAGAGRRAPQSRDRVYVVFTRDGAPAPDVAPRPTAWCPGCERDVRAVQSWKRPGAPWGRYRAQYLYRCPGTGCRNQVVEPYADPAATAIDWTLAGQRIGDRPRPLSAKTVQRIRAGLARYATAPTACRESGTRGLVVPVEGRDGKQATPVERPMRTQSTRAETALVVPSGGTWNEHAHPVTEPLRARTTRETDALVVPYYGTGVARPASAALPTQSTHDRFGLAFIAELRGGHSDARHVREPLATVTASGNHHALIEPPGRVPAVEDCTFRMLEPREIAAAMAFAPGYHLEGSRRDRVRQLGNAVTPPAAEFLLRAVLASLGGAP